MNIGDLALEILGKTHDGDDLDPRDLKLVEHAVNGFLTPKGEAIFQELHTRVCAPEGYKKPWLYGIEHLTIDNDGNVFWKTEQVDHLSFSERSTAQGAAERLAADCRNLEADGIKPSATSLATFWMQRHSQSPTQR